MKIKIRSLIFIGLAVLVLLGVFYKYSEYSFLKNTSSLYNGTWAQELEAVEDNTKYYNEAFGSMEESFESASTPEEFLEVIDDLEGKFNILENRAEDYLSTISKNQEKYKKLSRGSWFLLGSNAERAKDVVEKQIKYYQLEEEGLREGLAMLYGLQNLFGALESNVKLMDFYSKTAVNTEQNSKTFFPEIASLGKYDNPDFKFANEDELKKYYPEEYQILIKYKNYFASSYSLIKQYNAGQLESDSFAESYNRMLQDSAELNVDFDSLFSSYQERNRARTSDIITLISAQINQLSSLNNSAPNYPLVSDMVKADFYPVQCQLYNLKATSLFPSVTKKEIESERMEDLIEELNSISPKTIDIDGHFDFSLVEFENMEDEIKFICKGKYSDSRYEFIFPKQLN